MRTPTSQIDEVAELRLRVKHSRKPKTSRYDALCIRGMFRMLRGKVREALSDYESAVTLDCTRSEALCGKGLAQLMLGAPSSAVESLTLALGSHPQNAAEVLVGDGERRGQ